MDILRKVLMGIKDPQPSASAKETPRRSVDTAGRSQNTPATQMFIEAPQPKEAPKVQQPMAVNNNNNNLVSEKPGTSRSVEEAGDKKTSSAAAIPKEKESTYAKTSVLKHLLHRFTGANQ